MTENEDYVKKFKDLKDGHDKAEVARAEEEVRLEEQRLQEFLDGTESYTDIAKSRFMPIFEAMNEGYFDGEATIELEDNREGYVSNRENYPEVNLRMKWVRGSGLKSQITLRMKYDEARLEVPQWDRDELGLSYEEDEERRARLEFPLNDEDWEQKLVDGLTFLVDNPEVCRFRAAMAEPQEQWD